jgi:putative Mg2+ transporter-C (MgtC) family protein
MAITETEIFLRLLLSFICGTIVGLERQWRHKNAGLKTNTLVTVGATAFTIVAELGSGGNFLPQVAAGVVTGIGFIGGGVIMKRGSSVQGINSAATLWAAASIGLAIGRGYERLGLLVLGFIVAIQFVERQLASVIDQKSDLLMPDVDFTLEVQFVVRATGLVREQWEEFAKKTGVDIVRYVETEGSSGSDTVLRTVTRLSMNRVKDLTGLTHRLLSVDGVSRAEWSQRQVAETDGV